MSDARRLAEAGTELVVELFQLLLRVGGVREFLVEGGEDRLRIDDVVEVSARDEAVFPDKVERLDGEAAVLELAGLAADPAGEAVVDRNELQRGPREVDARAGMAGEIVRLQHAERGVDPAEVGIALVERRRDRQGVALVGLGRRRLEPVAERRVGRRSELSRQQACASEAEGDDKRFITRPRMSALAPGPIPPPATGFRR